MPFVEIGTGRTPTGCLLRCLARGIGDGAPPTYNATIGSAAVTASISECQDGGQWKSVRLSSETADADDRVLELPLGHQEDESGENPCPITAAPLDAPPRLAAVALVLHQDGERVLLTRRPTSMRIFPGAWVLPGGSVDAADESLGAAALREVLVPCFSHLSTLHTSPRLHACSHHLTPVHTLSRSDSAALHGVCSVPCPLSHAAYPGSARFGEVVLHRGRDTRHLALLWCSLSMSG